MTLPLSEAELDRPEYAAYKPGDTIGKDGLERFYNDTLMGKDGQRVSLVNNRGKELQVMTDDAAVAGQPVTLTIDLDLQAVAELTLQGKRGAVVALDPRTGEVLAMASRPALTLTSFRRVFRTPSGKRFWTIRRHRCSTGRCNRVFRRVRRSSPWWPWPRWKRA